MYLEFLVSKRYFFSLKNNNAVNILSGISTLGIMVSTMAMFIVFSVFSGLEKSTQDLLSSFNPSIKITPKQGKFFDYNDTTIAKIKSYKNVIYVSKTLEDKVLSKYEKKDLIVNLKGVDEDFLKKDKIKNSIQYGKWFNFNEKFNNYVVIGSNIALNMGIPKEDNVFPIEIFYPNKNYETDDSNDIFFSKKYYKKGIFNIEKDINQKYIISTLENVQNLFNLKKISSIEIETSPNIKEEDIIILKNSISNLIGNDFDIKTSKEQNDFFFKMVNTEKLASFSILVLILIISLFNIIGSVVMLILDKQKDIKILLNLGLFTEKVQNIFILQGLLITFLGCFLGIIFSSLFVLIQSEYGFIKMKFTSTSYPLIFKFDNLYITLSTILIMGILSSFISIKLILKKKIIKNF